MDRLLRLADAVGAGGEIPVAAALLDEAGRCVGWGSNRRHRRADPLGHAELLALRRAAAARGDWRFNGCTLLVTLEPCPMCAGALIQARVGTVIYGAADPKRGGLGGSLASFVLGAGGISAGASGAIVLTGKRDAEAFFCRLRLGFGHAMCGDGGGHGTQ
jgi:tRNA(Arg) A34 adenosine deaminase TadA